MRRVLRVLAIALGVPLLLVVALALVWQIVAEAVEPHYSLALASWLVPGSPPMELPAGSGTSVRLYADTRPHVGKITSLQKGLVWVSQGRELVEEGYGFGCPIVQWRGQGYVSRHAETSGQGSRLTKRYSIDTVDTPIRLLQRKFRAVPPLGVVVVTYDLTNEGVIQVDVNLAELRHPWDRLFLMNEQGGLVFTRYRDDRGTVLEARPGETWRSAQITRGCYETNDGRRAFCVEPQPPASVYLGRERYNQYNWRGIYYLSWAGIDIVLEPPQERYRYRITLLNH